MLGLEVYTFKSIQIWISNMHHIFLLHQQAVSRAAAELAGPSSGQLFTAVEKSQDIHVLHNQDVHPYQNCLSNTITNTIDCPSISTYNVATAHVCQLTYSLKKQLCNVFRA